MRKFLVFISICFFSSHLHALPIINLYQDTFELESSAEIELLSGGTESFNQSYSGHLLNNNVLVKSIDERYYIASEEDNFSVRSFASGMSGPPLETNFYRTEAYTEVYPFTGAITDSIQAVNDIRASVFLDWRFDVSGGDVIFQGFSRDEVNGGTFKLYDLTVGSLVFELTGFFDSELVTLLNGHDYALQIESITTNRDDAGIASDFVFRDANIIMVPEPPVLYLFAISLLLLCVQRYRQ